MGLRKAPTPRLSRNRDQRPRRAALLAAAAGAALGSAACRGPENAVAGDLASLQASMDPASLDLAWRATAPRGGMGDAGRPAGWARLDLATPPDLGASNQALADPRILNADLPFAPASDSSPPFHASLPAEERERALFCLTEAIYYEAAREPDAGQAAVAQVILNRVRHPAFPHSICGVIYQGAASGGPCQFTYVCDGARGRRPAALLWRRAGLAAERALNGETAPGLGAAIAYHADYVFPRWAPTMMKIAQIGAHIFYRFPGPWGRVQSLNRPYGGGELRVALNGRTAAAQHPIAGLAGRPAVGVAAFHDHQIESGRRAPNPDEIARINAALLDMEKALPAPPPRLGP